MKPKADRVERDAKVVAQCLRQQGQPVSPTALAEAVRASRAEGFEQAWTEALERFGLAAHVEMVADPGALPDDLMPCIAFTAEGALVLSRRIPGLAAAPVLFVRPRLDEDETQVPTSLGALLASWRPTVWRAALAGLLANLLALAAPIFSAQVYDRVLPHGLLRSLLVMAAAFAAAALFEQAFRRLRALFVEDALHAGNIRLATATHRRVLATRYEGATPPPGQLLRLLQDYDTIRDGFGAAAVSLLADLPFLGLFLIGLLLCDPMVAAAVVAMNLLIAALNLLTLHRQRQLQRSLSAASARRNQASWEAFADPEAARRIGASALLQARFRHAALAHAATTRAIRTLAAWRGHLGLLAQNLAVLGAVGLGGWEAIQGGMSAGVIIAATMLATRFTGATMQILAVVPQGIAALVALKSVREATSRPTERGRGKLVHKPTAEGRVTVEAVVVRYPGAAHPALSEVSLTLAPGERLAVVGPPGSGKSTLEKLLTGMLTPEKGRVRLDDVDLAALDPADLRRHVTTCPQTPLLFSGTVRDNLSLDGTLSDEAMVALLAALGAEQVMPPGMGLEFEVADGGRNLSGGQRQFLSLARACLRPAPVMILDEPTNGLDEASERRVVGVLDQIAQGRTLVLISHRAAVLTLARRTVAMNRGRLGAVEAARAGVRA
ncbi:peptidase domain-containing ABC transporter [Magnetospirillum sp. UT-4]|uniref:peptidase domain-containing ABC transporter n=1 Tax=Magnetospirillum sp. UT-4 TaxID=2681467 RepID=UPI0013848527|nr:ATP-binding cassette domain-containing protein [Magnetospirillum sp. UT-4]CAA7611618.1 putative ABC transporter ATP binding protein [Magnetospirillum sp. UT-4]